MNGKRGYTQFLQRPKVKIIQPSMPNELLTYLLEKEIELDKNPSLPLIKDVIALYTKAIESYETQENLKYLDLQERMHKMLLKPEIFSLLNSTRILPQSSNNPLPDISKPAPPPTVQTLKESSESSHKQLSSKLLSTLNSSTDAQSLLKAHQTSADEAKLNSVQALKSQEQSLNDKISTRKARRKTLSVLEAQTELSDDSEINTSTKSSLFLFDESKESYEKFEKRLEEIMESNLNERAMKICDTKFKYEAQIAEISESGEIFDMVVKEMRKNMQKEIDEIITAFDEKRKEEIRRLKEV